MRLSFPSSREHSPGYRYFGPGARGLSRNATCQIQMAKIKTLTTNYQYGTYSLWLVLPSLLHNSTDCQSSRKLNILTRVQTASRIFYEGEHYEPDDESGNIPESIFLFE